MIYAFEMEGPLLAYRAGLNRVFDPGYKRFKEAIRLIANTHCIPDEVGDKLITVYTKIYWKKSARLDGSNFLKAAEDALFRQDRKLIGGGWSMQENTGHTERAEIIVTVNDRS